MSKRLSWRVTVGTTLVQLPEFNLNDSVTVKADSDNAGVIYIGNDGSDSVAATTGFELQAGEYLIFDQVGKLGDIYAIASEADQYLYIIIGKV